jgi:acylphosphatase
MGVRTGAALRAKVRGSVQAVGFRDFVRTRALSLGLSGYVRNTPDGAVEVVAEGPRAELERLLGHLRAGPRGARVDDVDVRWGEATGRYDGFGVAFVR